MSKVAGVKCSVEYKQWERLKDGEMSFYLFFLASTYSGLVA